MGPASAEAPRIAVAPSEPLLNGSADPLRVAFLPVWHRNPYHDSLRRELARIGVEVTCPSSLKALCASLDAGERVDVVHLHALPSLEASWRELARFGLFHSRLAGLRRRGIATVRTVHDLHNHDASLWRLEVRTNRWLARQIDGLIVHGESARARVARTWGTRTAPIHVVPHGHYIDAYPNAVGKAEARAWLGIPPDAFVFLSLGFIRPYKGIEQMIHAFRGLADPGARLVVAGLPATAATERTVRGAIAGDPRITFAPQLVNDADVQRYLNASDVFVLPYKRVFTSGAAMLAMSFGRPCIAPAATPLVDMLGPDGAIYFDAAAPDGLTAAMARSLREGAALQRVGERNRARAEGFPWAGIARRTASAYRDALAHRAATLR